MKLKIGGASVAQRCVALVRTWRLGERRMEAEERALVEAMVWCGNG